MRGCSSLGTVLTIFTLFLSPGCGSDQGSPTAAIPILPVDALMMAPQTVTLGDQQYVLETYLWRDFMPISPPDGKPLTALVEVIEKNGSAIAPDLEMKYLWVINGREVWSTKFTDETPSSPEDELHRIARNGPLWGPGIEVEVIVALTRGDGPVSLLRASDQSIFRTD
ncbi:MAG TPA: hypothetical protein VLA34_06410 [Candidatus Krumholzibacterium sp.]|nr:hypothetical protein [Candidatus Krumholzibacterium sp.]